MHLRVCLDYWTSERTLSSFSYISSTFSFVITSGGTKRMILVPAESRFSAIMYLLPIMLCQQQIHFVKMLKNV